MGSIGDIGNIYKWWKESTEMVKAKDRLMIRGAGLLWIPLYWFLFVICIIIGTESYNKFVLYTIILPCIGFLILGVIFSIIEINRILILNRYERYAEKLKKEFKERQQGDFSNIHRLFNYFIDYITRDGWWLPSRLNDGQTETGKCYKELNDALKKFEKEYFKENEVINRVNNK